MLVILCAAFADSLFSRISLLKRLTNKMSVVYGIAFCLMLPALLLSWRSIMQLPKMPVTQRERAAWLIKIDPPYAAIKYLNDCCKSHYRVYVVGKPTLCYYADGQLIGDWFGPGRYSQVFDGGKTGVGLYKAMDRLKVGYLLVSVPVSYKGFKLPQDTFFKIHFKQVYSVAARDDRMGNVRWVLFKILYERSSQPLL
jgi:hypothetical protein